MIPKILHYIWFGNGEKTPLTKKCMESWKTFMPDFEIKVWDENIFNPYESCTYVKQAYEVKKWAFVSDYVRLKALYEYGGIYLDTDMELLKPICAQKVIILYHLQLLHQSPILNGLEI